MDARAATCIRSDPASSHCPPATRSSNHPPEGLMGSSVAPEHSSVPHSAGMDIGGMQAARILFLDLLSVTSGMEFCGDGTGPVFIKKLSDTPANHSQLTGGYQTLLCPSTTSHLIIKWPKRLCEVWGDSWRCFRATG